MSSSRLELALALVSEPISIDQLLDWGLARPTEAWSLLGEGQRQGWILEASGAGKGHFEICDEARRECILKDARLEDLRAIAGIPELAAGILATARKFAASGAFRKAAEAFRILLSYVDEKSLPGGEPTWLCAVLEAARIHPEMYGIPVSVIDRALELADAYEDEAGKCVLLAARGLSTIFGGRLGEARDFLRKATECVRTQSAALRTKVHLSIAAGLVRQGRLAEAIATFEELLDDVPAQLGQRAPDLIDSGAAAPAAAIANVAFAYTNAGHYARALDMLHRILEYGEQAGRPGLVVEMHLFIGLMHMVWGLPQEALGPTLLAFEHYSRSGSEPMYLWYAGVIIAWVRATEGNLAESRRMVAIAQKARLEAGSPPLMGPILFRIEELLGLAAFEGTGFDLIAEGRRVLEVGNIFTCGLTHRMLARQLIRDNADGPKPDRIQELLERAVEELREAGAALDLARALEDCAANAQKLGRDEQARNYLKEQRKLLATLPRPAEEDAGARFARHARTILDLGRLSMTHGRVPAPWGEMAARLSQGFGAERVALLQSGGPTSLLASRGGDPAWTDEVLSLPEPLEGIEFSETSGGGSRLRIPFAAEGLGRAGCLVMENRYSSALFTRSDQALLEALSTQLGVLLGNVLLWQEFHAAQARLEHENRYYRQQEGAPSGQGSIVGNSHALRSTLALVARVAPTDSAVLITGETGVGKELVAREIHRQSRRVDGPFIAVHIASLAPGLVASGLFGHEKGAFTGATAQVRGRFELADGGTLFLDEIGELGPEEQVRLLRVLQEGTFERVGGTKPIRSNFRLVTATNRDLAALARVGKFREDLYYRLNVFPLEMPPLRERTEDIPLLALYFMEQSGRRLGRRFEGISEADMARLASYPWPGNIRELMHCIERAAVLSDGPRLCIPPLLQADVSKVAPPQTQSGEALISLDEAERRHIRRVLAHTRGRITGDGGAAEILGLKPSTLHFRLGKLGLKADLMKSRKPNP